MKALKAMKVIKVTMGMNKHMKDMETMMARRVDDASAGSSNQRAASCDARGQPASLDGIGFHR